ncbi:MAG: cyclophilin-like fold protein [Lautropia sp.]
MSLSIDDAVALFVREREAIWLSAPAEIAVLASGSNPRGIGSRGQYLTPILFAEGAARSLADETLWGVLQLCDRPGIDLDTLKAVVVELVGRKVGFFELFGLEHVRGLVATYVAVAKEAPNVEALRRLTVAMIGYVNRVHVWIDAAFPWGLCSGYPRPAAARRVPAAAARSAADGSAAAQPAAAQAAGSGRVLKVALNISGREAGVVAIWEDRVPRFAAALRERLPITSIAQHGKIVGDLLFFNLPWVLPAENAAPLQAILRERRQRKGTASGAVCFYHPRQQICIYYSDDQADEPLEISSIGEIVEGEQDMQLAGIQCWTSPGEIVTMRLVR